MVVVMAFFADRLKALRSRAALSQSQLAERAGLGVSTVQQFEYGLREPSYGTLVKLARALGVSLSAFDQEDAPPPEPPPPKPPRRPRGGR
jgi:transcriptional regulator with XRE-family HTH domain